MLHKGIPFFFGPRRLPKIQISATVFADAPLVIYLIEEYAVIDLTDLLLATGGTLQGTAGATQFSQFAYDSRRIEPGSLFIAIQTTTGDGHDYIAEAVARGAGGVLCHAAETTLPVTTVLVSNTRQALQDYARYIVQKYRPQVVGVTGSNGKTTTKEAIAAALAGRFRVFKNFGSYSGRYGLPIALGRLTADCEIAVLEMACDSLGEMAEMTAIARPKIGVITSISAAHLAGFGSVENVALEKSDLIRALPADGIAVLNADNLRIAQISFPKNQTVTYGFSAGADVQATDVCVTAQGTRFTVIHRGERYAGETALLGRHQLYAVLAAVAVGLAYNIPVTESLAAVAALPRVGARLNPLAGQGGSMLLDDTFNANPASMRAAVDTLVELAEPTHSLKMAVLGRMADLGESSATAHAELGRYLVGRIDRLVAVGEAGQLIAQAAVEAGLPASAAQITFTHADAAQAVRPHLSARTMVLLKASAESRLERVVTDLLAEPERDRLHLARASAGWETVRIGLPDRPTWVEIDLEALGNNVACLARLAHPAKLMAVLKADAYGHGAVKIARTALNRGASWLGVATLGEALTLRRAGITAPVLVLGYLPAWQAGDALRHNIRATVFTPAVLEAFSEAAQRLHTTARLHLKVDTGMGRLGVLPQEAVAFVRDNALPNVEIEGIFTHFGRAEEADLQSARAQWQTFQAIVAELETLGLRPPVAHAANTAGLLNLPSARFDMVRAGIGLYGLAPSADTPLPPEMRPVLAFKTTIGQVKTLPPGSPIGYGAAYTTQTQETIAVIPVGYADGFRRGPYTWGEVLVKGQRAPLVGRVSMDQATINVTHIPNVRQGDEVVLIGRQGSESLTAEEVAARLGTINYEVISQILARVPRIS